MLSFEAKQLSVEISQALFLDTSHAIEISEKHGPNFFLNLNFPLFSIYSRLFGILVTKFRK